MPGHNTLSNLGSDQVGTEFEGKFLSVGSGAPGNADQANPIVGVGRGGLYLRTDGGAAITTLYCNRGTAGTPDWCHVILVDF